MDIDKLRPKVRDALDVFAGEAACRCHEAYTSRGMKDPQCNHDLAEYVDTIRAELLRLADENIRLNKVESRATEQRLQMEDVELYLMDVSQPEDEDADWCERMKSAIECLVQDCNEAVGQKNQANHYAEKAEAELASIKAKPAYLAEWTLGYGLTFMDAPTDLCGKRVRLVVEE